MSAGNSDLESPEKGAIASAEGQSDFNSDERSVFLSSFTHEEEKRVIRKVDQRFLLLIGIMYLIKTVRHSVTMRYARLTMQIDYSNASNIKVLQVGESRNILKELDMTADQYNWVQSIYFVRLRPLHNTFKSRLTCGDSFRSAISSSKLQAIFSSRNSHRAYGNRGLCLRGEWFWHAMRPCRTDKDSMPHVSFWECKKHLEITETEQS